MVVVDGRTTESAVLVLTDLAQHMLAKGCVNAINLDGGGSSSMAIKGSNNIFAPINKPSDAAGERPVGNGLLIIDPTTSVKLADLNSKITEATNLINNSQYGYEIGKYPEEQKNILNAAIVNAKAAKVDENKNQASIDQAVIVLQNAINEFENSKILVNTGELEELINKVEYKLEDIVFGEEIGNYSPEQEQIINQALQEAKEVINDPTSTKEEIDAAISNLKNKLNDLNKAMVTTPKEPNEPSNPSEPNDPIEPITPKEPNSNNEVLFLFIGLGAGIVLSIIIFYVLKIVKKK